ncbi:hypothetical protein B0T42_01610 [Rathayibacter sp. VKM Ac-2630]|nr:hypothetical protein B0T42_01610 [Rathayibacter sp. VKM Ac-2630]
MPAAAPSTLPATGGLVVRVPAARERVSWSMRVLGRAGSVAVMCRNRLRTIEGSEAAPQRDGTGTMGR